MSDRKANTRLYADERMWIVPGRWWRRTEPWRGRAGYRVTVDHRAAQRVRDLLYGSVAHLRAALDHPDSDPTLAAPALAVLNSAAGEPIGTGVVAALVLRLLPPPDRDDVADLLVAWYGLEFAAVATVWASRVRVVLPDDAAGRTLEGASVAVERGRPAEAVADLARRLRALLAVVSDRSYARTITALASVRGDEPARRLIAYLAPSEPDWVAEAVADLGAEHDPHWSVTVLFTAVATAAQAARVAAVAGGGALATDTRVLFSLAAHVGPDSATLIAECARNAPRAVSPRAVRILACFPTDEAFGLLIDLLPEPGTRAALRAAVTAFPERARRMLTVSARRADAVGRDCARLLADHLAVPVEGPRDFRPWLDLTALPGVAPADAMRLCALFAGPEHDYVETLVAALDDANRAAFGWALFERWRAAGMPAEDDWVWTALAATADDACAVRLADLVQPATRVDFVLSAVDTLIRIGSETALAQLIRLTGTLPPDAARAAAERGVTAVAERLGLTADQLADRRAPTCGLGSDGALPLPDGTRVPLIVPAGPAVTELRFLPRRVLAPEVAERVAAAERELDVVAARQAARLEAAMVSVRTWTAGEYRDVVLGHPVLRHLARQLVWVALDESGAVRHSFRVTADGDLRDDRDRGSAPDAEYVAVAHPLHLGDALPYWRERFAEDRVRQPFAQLDRTVHRLTEREAAATSLARFADRMVATSALLRLENSGWFRGAPADGGIQDHLYRPVGADLQVLIVLDDGIDVSDPLLIPEQVLASVELTAGPPRHWMQRCGDTRFARLDPITASEILRDLEILVT
ncbi:DUF4132 domain-containing protein [Nocardia arizonensis]|uniref:DUF4132 domain-containing protein n=1 Tax=Nocardia arizonensis TaxID=1141647 RepID=UPI0006D2772C|nr:DUF4132 domain-containing protein [Nocardia arizonensis]